VTAPGAPAFEATGVTKEYGGLRPLRVRSLTVPAGSIVAIAGLDAPAAETLVNLLTGATLPDSGEVRLFGRRTSDIVDADDWLKTIDRLGIVSGRAVLLEELTAAQNVAMTRTLDVEPLGADVRHVVDGIAREVSLEPAALDRKVAALGPPEKLRVRLARAIALDPAALLLEHHTATLSREDVPAFAAVVVRVAKHRGVSVLAATADASFATAIATTAWTWKPADGSLTPLGPGVWGRIKRLLS
jgi:ABC-type lipoprotein export system ATPase subunit